MNNTHLTHSGKVIDLKIHVWSRLINLKFASKDNFPHASHEINI